MANENEQTGGTIPVADATVLTANWRAWIANPVGQFDKKAFLIPIGDITSILATNQDLDGIRVYLTLEDPKDIATANAIVVPVKNGKDVVRLPPKSGPGGVPGDDEGDTNIYNYSTPCPPVCDVDSDLNGKP